MNIIYMIEYVFGRTSLDILFVISKIYNLV